MPPLILARTDRVAVAVVGATAYPSGFKFYLSIYRRPLAEEDDFEHDPFGFVSPRFRRVRGTKGSTEIPPEFLRLGVQFADRSKATNLSGHWSDLDSEEEPPGPVLMERRGGGSGGHWSQSYWVWPLPPPGALAFVCEWPIQNIPEARAELDADLVLSAADDAEVLWPETERSSWARSISSFDVGHSESRSRGGDQPGS
jgi:hypothetical protein